VIVGIYLGVVEAANYGISAGLWGWVNNLPELAGSFILGSENLVIVGICVFLSGRAIRWYLEHDTRLLRNVALIVIIGWSRQILDATSAVLKDRRFSEGFIWMIVIGILLGIASFLIIIVAQRSAKGFFQRTEGQAEDFAEG
jgi:hypothetical protein